MNQRSQGFSDSVGKSEVGEERRQGGDQGQSCGIRGSLRALQINLQTLHQQGLEGGQIPHDLTSLFHPVYWSVRSYKRQELKSEFSIYS